MEKIIKSKYLGIITMLLLLLNIQSTTAQNELTAQQELEKSFFHGARTSDMELLNKFIESGVDINYQGENGYTGLMVAAYNGQKEAVEFLLDKGANLCIKDKRGNTALMGAIVAAEDEISEILIKKGNCDESISQRTLEFATRFDRKKIITLLKTKK
ncbi:ankyrin repeat domain-containing protein [Aquimarina sp. I32.4]|uniref:ankyrin repeat domain-containing protein n=1 Tax=Aquimarina sp. I32.4 TaxID=2053903 RepID=UPI0018EA946E|nr:ankyrin repeat domain-containing protein [Aquimarina sp. I32.4]